MSRTVRDTTGALMGAGVVRDGQTLSRSRGYRAWKTLMSRVRRSRDRLAVYMGREPERWPKMDEVWW
jgi:hypothetical protein